MICRKHGCFMQGHGTAIFCPACKSEQEKAHSHIPSAGSAGFTAYGAKVNKFEKGRVFLITPGIEHGMTWFEAQNLAARLMDAAAESLQDKKT